MPERIPHPYPCYARGGDILLGTFTYLDLTPQGRQDEIGVMNWLRGHDEYPALTPSEAVGLVPEGE